MTVGLVGQSQDAANIGPAEEPSGSPRAAIAYLVLFTVAALVLLASARNGAVQYVVQALLMIFVVAATLWVRNQYVADLEGRQWVLPGSVAFCMVIGSVALMVVWLVTHRGGLGLLALYALWLGGSALLTRMRDSTVRGRRGWPWLGKFFAWSAKRARALGISLTAVGVALLIIGVVGVGFGTRYLIASAAVLGVGALLALPVGVGLASEVAISHLSGTGGPGQGPGARRGIALTAVAVAGLMVFVAVAVLTAWLAQTAWVLLVFAAIVLIVVALASSTHADIALAMAWVALLGVTPYPQLLPEPMTVSAPANESLETLVAIGDSYLSGEGASIYFDGTDVGGGNQCRRAPSSWAALAADQGFQALEFLACSGAATGNVLYDPGRSNPESSIPSRLGAQQLRDQLRHKDLIGPQKGEAATQLDQWRVDRVERGLHPRMVVVSLGGNDAGFSTIGAMCIAPGSCSDRAELWQGSLDQVRAQLRLAYLEIAETFPDTPVITVGYPDPIDRSVDDCRQVWLTDAERKFIHEFLTGPGGLNSVIRATSKEFGFYYVDIERSLADAHLQLCDPRNGGRPGLNFIGLRSVGGAAEQRFNPTNWIHSSLHPNERGHAVLLRSFQTWLAGQPKPLLARLPITTMASAELGGEVRDWEKNASQEAEETATHAGQCDLFETSPIGCRTQGADWALGQISALLLRGGLWLCLAGALLAWVAAVAFFAGRRRRWRSRTLSDGTAPSPIDPAAQRGGDE